jgi:hypothetical protein
LINEGQWRFVHLDHDEASLAKGRALHRECLRSPGVALVEVVVIMVGHRGFDLKFKEEFTKTAMAGQITARRKFDFLSLCFWPGF